MLDVTQKVNEELVSGIGRAAFSLLNDEMIPMIRDHILSQYEQLLSYKVEKTSKLKPVDWYDKFKGWLDNYIYTEVGDGEISFNVPNISDLEEDEDKEMQVFLLMFEGLVGRKYLEVAADEIKKVKTQISSASYVVIVDNKKIYLTRDSNALREKLKEGEVPIREWPFRLPTPVFGDADEIYDKNIGKTLDDAVNIAVDML